MFSYFWNFAKIFIKLLEIIFQNKIYVFVFIISQQFFYE